METLNFPTHAFTVMVISDRARPSVRVTLNYFGMELWAETAGYAHEAPVAFIASDTDHRYVDGHAFEAAAGAET